MGVNSEHRAMVPLSRARNAFSLTAPSNVPLVITSIACCNRTKCSFFFGSLPVLSG